MDLLNYLLSWEDDFDYPDSQLDANRTSQHGPPVIQIMGDIGIMRKSLMASWSFKTDKKVEEVKYGLMVSILTKEWLGYSWLKKDLPRVK